MDKTEEIVNQIKKLLEDNNLEFSVQHTVVLQPKKDEKKPAEKEVKSEN